MAGILPYGVFPGFSSFGVVSDVIKEIAVTFNAEGLDALSMIPDKIVQWAEIGTRVTAGQFEAKIPVRLTSLLGFEPMEGERKYHQVNVGAVAVKINPYQLNLQWPIQIQTSGNVMLQDFYGVSGIAQDVVSHARAFKADLLASLIIRGITNASLGLTAQALTLAQPGLPNGLPLFSDGVTSGSTKHYSNPIDMTSPQFSNLHLNVGLITNSNVFGQMLVDMTQIPHPSKANATLGLEVTDIIGGTNMLIPFWQTAVQNLSLQTTTTPGNIGAATTNIYNPELIQRAGASGFIGPSGLAPWRFWIAPQLDAHPYIQANPTRQMWFAVSRSKPSLCWAELGSLSKEFMPRIRLLGDGTEEAAKTNKISLLGDLDGGVAAGLPHAVAMYTETTP